MSGFWGDFATSRFSASVLTDSTCTIFRVAYLPIESSIGKSDCVLSSWLSKAFSSLSLRGLEASCASFIVGSVVLLTSCDGSL